MRCCWEVCRRSTLHCRCPLSARLDAPTPLLPPGFILLLIGGGCLLCPPLCRRWAGVYFAGMWPRGTRESSGRGPAATTAMWPAVLTGGRPSPEAAGQLPAGSALALCRSASGGNIDQIKRPATGRWRTYNRLQVDAGAATGSCPNEAR